MMKRKKMTPDIQVEIHSKILSCSQSHEDSAGRKITILKDSEARDLAEKYQLHMQAIYEETLALGVWPYRYIRNSESISFKISLNSPDPVWR
jgi:hypothetical protein